MQLNIYILTKQGGRAAWPCSSMRQGGDLNEMEQWCVNRFLTDECEKVDRVQKEEDSGKMNRAQH